MSHEGSFPAPRWIDYARKKLSMRVLWIQHISRPKIILQETDIKWLN